MTLTGKLHNLNLFQLGTSMLPADDYQALDSFRAKDSEDKILREAYDGWITARKLQPTPETVFG